MNFLKLTHDKSNKRKLSETTLTGEKEKKLSHFLLAVYLSYRCADIFRGVNLLQAKTFKPYGDLYDAFHVNCRLSLSLYILREFKTVQE